MYYNSYEEYMNSLLGKSNNIEKKIDTKNISETNSEFENIEEIINSDPNQNTEIDTYDLEISKFEDLYPDIYKIIYPVVCKKCLNVNEEISEDLVDKITDDIYYIVEKDEQEEQINKFEHNNYRNNRNFRYIPKYEEIYKAKKETRQKNFLLNDLIKILVLRELIGNGRKPPRPIPPRPPIIPPPPPPRPNERPLRF